MARTLEPYVLIADDHGLYRSGLSLLLRDSLAAETVVEASSFDEALDKLAGDPAINLALFDLSMPGMSGPTDLKIVKETYPSVAIAVISASENREHVLDSVSIGLGGFIPKSLEETEIVDALRMVLSGQIYVPKFMARGAGRGPAPMEIGGQDQVSRGQGNILTPRQRDVLDGVRRGLSNKEIARELDIAEGTVKIHLAALLNHFSVRNRTELAAKTAASNR
ncbi:MAG: response regulator [Hyphomicrobiaceae bacterium]